MNNIIILVTFTLSMFLYFFKEKLDSNSYVQLKLSTSILLIVGLFYNLLILGIGKIFLFVLILIFLLGVYSSIKFKK